MRGRDLFGQERHLEFAASIGFGPFFLGIGVIRCTWSERIRPGMAGKDYRTIPELDTQITLDHVVSIDLFMMRDFSKLVNSRETEL